MKTKKDLLRVLEIEKNIYFPNGFKREYKFRKTINCEIYKYIVLLRKYEYFCKQRDASKNLIANKFWVTKIKLCDRKKNSLGVLLGIEVLPNRVQPGLRICHQNVVINGQVGENCVFHGNNVIGNKRTGAASETPIIGNRVDIGVGATIIGDIQIADDCIIGAGSVVTKSFPIPGTIIAGVPAKAIKPIKE